VHKTTSMRLRGNTKEEIHRRVSDRQHSTFRLKVRYNDLRRVSPYTDICGVHRSLDAPAKHGSRPNAPLRNEHGPSRWIPRRPPSLPSRRRTALRTQHGRWRRRRSPFPSSRLRHASQLHGRPAPRRGSSWRWSPVRPSLPAQWLRRHASSAQFHEWASSRRIRTPVVRREWLRPCPSPWVWHASAPQFARMKVTRRLHITVCRRLSPLFFFTILPNGNIWASISRGTVIFCHTSKTPLFFLFLCLCNSGKI